MGKGGNANAAFINDVAKTTNETTSNALELERKTKMNKAPEFHWASGDSLEEPHVRRLVFVFFVSVRF